jgi:uncharacterized protein (TIGR01777 family)
MAMNVAVTGSSGMVGSALVAELTRQGARAVPVVRRASDANSISWDPEQGTIEAEKFSAIDTVVHLAGENIAGRWTAEKKARIRDSRVQGTKLLCEALAGLAERPQTLIAASAIGYYGDRGDTLCTESTSAGEGFLAEICIGWEEATNAALHADIRVVNLRIGVVLHRKEGALSKMLPPFRLGLGGRVGSGRQYWSWITLPDLVRVILFAVHTTTLHGPVNAVAPQPVTNRQFTKTLGRVLHRPTILPMPAFAARLMLGEMADGLLLASARVVPEKLQEHGFDYQYPELQAALTAVLQP